ncbi:hypothetical protein AAKU67_000183 [Oxalobacteraceae bacterium GrIS 2.11]
MDNPPNFPATHLRPWNLLDGVDDAEVWVANSNLELNYFLEQDRNAGMPVGQGICFNLSLGGDVYLHTTSEGMILLDVTEDADWVRPIIEACTFAKPAKGQIWVLPENTLIQLILGLNSLIASSSIVMHHDFGMRF